MRILGLGGDRGTAAQALVVFAAASAFTIGSVASANAASWFAAPAGSGSNPCVETDPCQIRHALNNAPADSKVTALAGTYAVGASGVSVSDGISLQGPWSGSPAVVVGDGSAGPAVSATGARTRVTDLSIEQSGLGTGIEVADGALADRVIVVTSGSSGACAPSIDGLIRDSVCSATGTGNGVQVDEGTPVSGDVQITNVTAVSAGGVATASPILVRATGGAELSIGASNVIASGATDVPEIEVGALGPGSTADLDLDHSNYDSVLPLGAPDAQVTPVGSPTNQSVDPIFTDPPAGDFSAVVPSPTIDAGSASPPSLGLLDLVRRARIRGSAPDIGADEYIARPDTEPPNVFIVSAPKGKLKTTELSVEATFELASDEPDVRFTCRLDRTPAERCSSPVTYTLDSSRGAGTPYLLTVTAIDAAGNQSGKAVRSVTVIRKSKH
jgi:hypothetical protein